MPLWEYHTTCIESDAKELRVKKVVGFENPKLPPYSMKALEFHINQLGKQGWELVSCEPVVRGDNDDVCVFRWSGVASSGIWTHSYLCVFKRQIIPQPPTSPI